MSTKEKYKQGDPITWLQVHNLLPIFMAIVSAIAVYNALSTKVSILEQKLSFQESSVSACRSSLAEVETKLNSQSLDIKELQTKGSVKGITTTKPVATPAPEKE